MARLLKEAHEAIIQLFQGVSELTPEMLDGLQSLRDDYDESIIVPEEKPNEWEGKYNELFAQYKERFFNTPSGAKQDNITDTKDDGDQDGTTMETFEDLFKKREGTN